MNLILPNCRSKFTDQDVAFIQSTLAGSPHQSDLLQRLFTDAGSRDLILDDDALYHALLESTDSLHVSLRLYFYVLVRHALRDAGMDNRLLADYLAELLSTWAQTHPQYRPVDLGPPVGNLEYVTDFMEVLATADRESRFYIMVYFANHYLMMTGVFPEHIRHRTERRGAPRLEFYEEAGRRGFEMASGHHLAQARDLRDLFHLLSREFRATRMALNDLAERLMFVGS